MWKLWQFFLTYINKYKFSFLFIFFSFIFIELICYRYLDTYLYKTLIDNISKLTLKEAFLLMVFYSSIIIIYECSFIFVAKSNFNLNIKMRKDIELDLFKHILKYDLNYFNNNFAGSLSNKINSVALNFRRMFIYDVVGCFIMFIWIFIILLCINIYLALFLIIWFIMFVYFSINTYTKVVEYSKQTNEEISKSNGIIIDCFSNINNIKSFSNETKEYRTLKKQSNNILRNKLKIVKIRSKYSLYSYLFTSIFILCCIFVCFYEYQNKYITLGSFIFITQLTSSVIISLKGNIEYLTGKLETVGAINNGLQTLLKKPEVIDDKEAKKFNYTDIVGRITFKNVNFAYINEDKNE